MARTNDQLTEKQLAESFGEIQREVAEQIRKYEEQYPEFAHQTPSADEVVQQPVYSYDIHVTS